MDKEETTKELMKLMSKREETESEIKRVVWSYFNGDKEIPDYFPYKKWIREEFGLVI